MSFDAEHVDEPDRRPLEPRSDRRAEPRPDPGAARPARKAARGLPAWTVPIAVIIALLAGEMFARTVGPHLPVIAGTDQESVLKADQLAARTGQRTDLVFVGASETAAGLEPTVVDAASHRFDGAYNAALRGASPATDDAWVRRVVLRRLRPKVVVVGLLPTSLAVLAGAGGQFEAQSDSSYAAAFDRIDPTGVARLEKPAAKRSALIRYRSSLRQPTALIDGLKSWVTGKAAPVDPNTDPAVIRKAIAPTGETIEYRAKALFEGPDPQGSANLQSVGRAPINLAGLESLFKTVHRQGLQVVLVLAPIDRRLLRAGGLDFTDLDRTAGQAAALARRLGVPVLNTFTSDYPSDLFHDKQHLDAAGSDRWSGEVGTWLDQLCEHGQLGQACAAA